jgi:quercetin dioxygenase-like cupin family protein
MDGEIITRLPARDVVLLTGEPGLTVTFSRYAAGERGPGLHVHREHTDAFYVLEGELTFGLGPEGEPARMGAGGFVAVPPNVGHAFANESGADARWLNFHAPDMGFAAYMRGARDGETVAWDSFDMPADGGLPAAGVTVIADLAEVELPELRVRRDGAAVTAEAGGASFRY